MRHFAPVQAGAHGDSQYFAVSRSAKKGFSYFQRSFQYIGPDADIFFRRLKVRRIHLIRQLLHVFPIHTAIRLSLIRRQNHTPALIHVLQRIARNRLLKIILPRVFLSSVFLILNGRDIAAFQVNHRYPPTLGCILDIVDHNADRGGQSPCLGPLRINHIKGLILIQVSVTVYLHGAFIFIRGLHLL